MSKPAFPGNVVQALTFTRKDPPYPCNCSKVPLLTFLAGIILAHASLALTKGPTAVGWSNMAQFILVEVPRELYLKFLWTVRRLFIAPSSRFRRRFSSSSENG